MIGSKSIGSQWLGSGRAQRLDYVDLVAGFQFSTDLDGEARAGKAMSAAFVSSITLEGSSKRLRGIGCSLSSDINLAGRLARVRPLAASFDSATDLSGRAARVRPMSAAMSASIGIQARAARSRKLGASFAFQTGVAGRVARVRPMAASMQLAIGMVASALRGRNMSAAFSSVASLVITEIRTFFNPAQAGRIIFVPEKIRDIEVPVKQRTIIFDGDDRGLSMQEPLVKQPREVVDYMIDMQKWFRSIPEDFITDVQIEIDIQGDPEDLESGPGSLPIWVPVGDPIHQAKMWFAGGRDGIEYKVTALVTTNRGRVEEVDFLVRVEEQ